MHLRNLIVAVGLSSLVFGVSACGEGGKTRSTSELLPALLSVNDMPKKINSTPVEWYENMRKVITDPAPPWENTLDPYLCSEASTPEALTTTQVQLELTGGSVMEILLSSDDAQDLYSELDDAYKACTGSTVPAYAPLAGIVEVGDESATYKSDQGVVTIARLGNDIMILKWWVGEYYDQVAAKYPAIVAKAASKVDAL